MLDALVQGILLGGYYAILAAGLSLMFGVIRFINLAHGDLAVLGAYVVLFLVERFHMPVGYAILVMVPVLAVAGLFAPGVALRPHHARRLPAASAHDIRPRRRASERDLRRLLLDAKSLGTISATCPGRPGTCRSGLRSASCPC